MENSPRIQEIQGHSFIPSPNSNSSNSSTSSSGSSSNSNGLLHPSSPQHQQQPPPQAPVTPIPITRSEPNNPYPTTFVQADTNSFKQVVQLLTGSSETAKLAGGSVSSRSEPQRNPIPPMKTGPRKEKTSKLYERRNSLKNFRISPLVPGLVNHSVFSGSPRKPVTPEILSPSILDFPSLVLSPVTPLIADPFNKFSPQRGVSANSNLDLEAEDKAISKKGFFLHPSPANTPRESQPRLLPLFPLTSPRVSGSADSSS